MILNPDVLHDKKSLGELPVSLSKSAQTKGLYGMSGISGTSGISGMSSIYGSRMSVNSIQSNGIGWSSDSLTSGYIGYQSLGDFEPISGKISVDITKNDVFSNLSASKSKRVYENSGANYSNVNQKKSRSISVQ